MLCTHRKICRFVKDLRFDSMGRYTQHTCICDVLSNGKCIVGNKLYRIVDSTT
ncbi:unnamed protein product [Callosobruchus maculatus]|uniref:Uncharacterized protein n=1 Tax=Callosobruchus maculatus TaxID=64391 RepID=A0A653DFD0_CALMS|nr:unnamed protein product [Callosobruchus maculatus]